jgi:hypothetical protein
MGKLPNGVPVSVHTAWEDPGHQASRWDVRRGYLGTPEYQPKLLAGYSPAPAVIRFPAIPARPVLHPAIVTTAD